jgi:drug/metabolite transporter (DMT)-like permease
MLLVVIGAMSWAGGSLYSKYNSTGGSVSVNSAWQMFSAGLAFFIASLIREEQNGFVWSAVPTDAWLSVIYLILFGSIAAFSAYVWLLEVRPATQVSTYAYVNPVVAVLLGVLFANESITMLQILGLVVILGSVLLINLAKYRKARVVALVEKY